MTNSIYNEVKKYFEENEIVNIPSETKFWMVRTQSGEFFEEFTRKGFVALGWNDLTPEVITRAKENDSIKTNVKETITEEYDSKQPGHVFNRCDRFINEISIGDYVIIPGKNSDVIAFAQITSDCYIEENLKFTEVEYNELVKSGYKEVFEELECPFSKRRKINVLTTIEKKDVSPMIYKAMTSYQSLNDIEHYDIDILSTIYKIYNYKGNMYLNYNVRKKSNIKAIDYSGFIHSVTSLISTFTEDDEIFVKSNVNSPGIITFIFSEITDLATGALGFLNSNKYTFLILYVVLFGGKLGPIEVNSIYDIWKNRHDKDLDNMQKEANIEKTKIETEKERYELEKMKREDAKLQPIVDTLIATAKNLEIYDSDKENQPLNENETDK